MKRFLLILAALCGAWLSARAAEEVYTVDCRGGGQFRSVQACFDALPSKPAAWRTVVIRPGTYREKVTLDVYKDKVRIVAAEAGTVRIVWNDYSGKVVDGRELTTYDSYTMSLQADDVFMQGITVENDAGRVGQAVALETRGDRIHLCDCALVGDQDTFFTKGYVSRIYVERCHIEGTTDFIFGPSIVLFDDCTMRRYAERYDRRESLPVWPVWLGGGLREWMADSLGDLRSSSVRDWFDVRALTQMQSDIAMGYPVDVALLWKCLALHRMLAADAPLW